jgi:hypothetical protein
MFQLSPGVELTPKQFSYKKRKVVQNWFKDADKDKSKELSEFELLDYASSLSERSSKNEKCIVCG